MPRKRKDPDDAPIDGDYALDKVINKQAGYTYKWLSPDDVPRFKTMGYVREERATDSARPAFDHSHDLDAGYQVGQLTLYKAPDALAAKWDRAALKEAADRMATIRKIAKRSGGEFSTQVQR